MTDCTRPTRLSLWFGGLSAALLATTAAGCTQTGDPLFPTSDVSADVSGDTGSGCLTYAEIQAIFTSSCVNCHGGGSPQSGVDLTAGNSYGDTVGVASTADPASDLVVPGAPEESVLYLKLLASPPFGGRMPFGGALPPGQIAAVEAWIAAGAPETGEFGTCGPTTDVDEVAITTAGPVQVPVGDTRALSAEARDVDGQVLADAVLGWSTGDESLLYVDKTGVLLGIAPGTTTVMASADGVDSAPMDIEVVANTPPTSTFPDVRNVFDSSCALASCHIETAEAGDLRLDRDPIDLHADVLKSEGHGVGAQGLTLIVPGQPESSYIFLKLTRSTPPAGAQMPFGAAPMDSEKVQTILRWILGGAPGPCDVNPDDC